MKTLLLAVIIVWLTSCQKPVTQEELIEQALEIKLIQWKQEQLSICREQAMMKAEHYVDSLMAAVSLDLKLDTIPKPAKPLKPPKPVFKEKPDSIVVDQVIRKDE